MSETEVKGGSPEVANLLKYIAEREDNLSNYSDKLRQNVEAIFSMFGYTKFCRICDQDKFEHDNFPQEFDHEYTPPIQVSIALKGKTFRHVELKEGDPDNPTTLEYYLEMPADTPYIRIMQDKTYKGDVIGHKEFMPDRVNRETLKALVSSGELIRFLSELADKLQEVGEDYREVAEKAERMAQAISP